MAKFKVGDRVRPIKDWPGVKYLGYQLRAKGGTITAPHDANGAWYVKWDASPHEAIQCISRYETQENSFWEKFLEPLPLDTPFHVSFREYIASELQDG